MRLLGFNISRTSKAAPPVPVAENRGGWYPLIRESFSGAWQRNITIDRNLVLSYHAVYACMTLIASDIAKLRVKLVENQDGIWTELDSAAFSPVLRRPNRYQNRIQFWEAYILSKLSRGNTYVLKARDQRGLVTSLYVLDPNRVKAMVADDGSVFYELQDDNMAGGHLTTNSVMVPASEIIHDRFNCLFHPLVGVSPIYAAGLAATQGMNIQNQSVRLFANNSQPGGILTAPDHIPADTAKRLKEDWEQKFTGENAGRVAVMGDGLKYEKMSLTAVEGQLIEQLKWSAEVVCSAFHVPPYKIGVGTMPTYNNIQSLNVEYYSQCLQSLIESAELCLDEGLGLDTSKDGRIYGTEFDLDGLLRMDSVTQMEVLEKASGVMTIDEKRKKLDLKATDGGDAVYLQQQNYSLSALAKRDAQEDPFGTAAPVSPPPPDDDATQADKALFMRATLRKELGLAA